MNLPQSQRQEWKGAELKFGQTGIKYILDSTLLWFEKKFGYCIRCDLLNFALTVDFEGFLIYCIPQYFVVFRCVSTTCYWCTCWSVDPFFNYVDTWRSFLFILVGTNLSKWACLIIWVRVISITCPCYIIMNYVINV